MTNNISRRHLKLAAVAIFAVAIAGCSSSSKSATGATGTTSATASPGSSSLGAPNAASQGQTPITIGFINQDVGSVAAYPEGKAAALAAQSYINDYLGGVKGHPLKIDTCSTDGTLATDQSCAQQMVSDKAIYVQSGISFNSYAWDPILGPAGIPIIGFNPFTSQEYAAKDSFAFGALPGGIAALAQQIASQPGVKTVALVVNTVPGSLAVVPLIEKALSAHNVKTKVVKYDEGSPNLLATYVSAKSEANAIIANLSTPDCIAFAEAATSQNNTLPIAFNGTCISPSAFKAAGNDMNGWYTSSTLQDPNGSDPQASVYRAAMQKYAPSVSLSILSQQAFSDVMTGYYNVLKPVGPSVTSQSAVSAITAPRGGQIFMGPAYKCPGAVLPSVCSTSVAILQVKGTKASYLPGYLDVSKTFAAELQP
jgi:branched-chain amino acid transport system substrate-binding protein